MTTFTIIDTVNHSLNREADFIVHKHNCADALKRTIFPDMLHAVEAPTAADAAEKFRRSFYTDFEPATQDTFSCRIMPCCR